MKNEFTRNQQLILNMSASFVAYGVSLFISFFLSPYIVRTIGVEANGFIGLANNFVSYASLVTIALNSLAGRFITISVTEGNESAANKYFSSVFIANSIIAAILVAIGSGVIIHIDKLISVPKNLLADIRVLFICLFLNCVIGIVGSVFSVATFAKNMLYLESIRNIEANLGRAIVIIGLFACFKPQVSYVGIASLISGIYVLFCNCRYTKILLPNIHIKKSYFDIDAIKELVSSGIWNTINRLGQIFLNDLDLLVTNMFISAEKMGVLALSHTVPNMIGGIISSVVGVFSPNFTILYAEKKQKELVKTVKQAMHIMGIITDIPIIGLIVCGKEFFELWQPTQDAKELQILSFLAISIWIISGSLNCIYHIFTVVNKIKVNSLITLMSGAITIFIVLILLEYTNLGVFAVAGVSVTVSAIRNIVFTAPYGAKCIGEKWYSFYSVIFRSVAFVVVASVISYFVCLRIRVINWYLLVFKGVCVTIVSIMIAFLIFLNKAERILILNKFRRIKSKCDLEGSENE